MQDSLGVYYLPRPGLPAVRVYVRRGETGEIEFRMWDQDHPEVWEKHQWLPLSVIQKAAALFREMHAGSGEDPMNIYDNVVAESLLREWKRR